MAQVTSGVRAVLSHPLIYSAFQSLMGAHQSRLNFVENYIKPFPDMKILDIGCGPADILDYLENVKYWGYDISESYIAKAKEKFGDRGNFSCKIFEKDDLSLLPKYDVILALGLLHHLDDDIAKELMTLAMAALKPGGKLLTLDPCFDPAQSAVARFLVSKDRGQNVRDKESYQSLASGVFSSVVADVRHQVWIPYTHCIMECKK